MEEPTIKLTDRELEILMLLETGLVEKEIAAKLNIEVDTVKFHVRNLFSKFDVHNSRKLVHEAKKLGFFK